MRPSDRSDVVRLISGPESTDALTLTPGGRARLRVLHLVRPACVPERPTLSLRTSAGGSDAAAILCAAMIQATPNHSHNVVLFGGTAAQDRAASFGLSGIARIAPPFGQPELAGPPLRRIVRECGEPDVVQCWGGEFSSLQGQINAPLAVWNIVDVENGVLHSGTAHEPPVRTLLTAWLDSPSTLAPSVLRSSTLRIALLGDPPSAVDAVSFAYTLGILHVAGVRAIAMVPLGAKGLARTMHHVRAGGYIHAVEIIDRPITQIARECDLAISLPPGEEDLSFASKVCVCVVAGSGTPVILPDTPWARAVIPSGAHQMLAPTLKPASLARVVQRLLDGQNLEACRAALRAGLCAPHQGAVGQLLESWGSLSGIGR